MVNRRPLQSPLDYNDTGASLKALSSWIEPELALNILPGPPNEIPGPGKLQYCRVCIQSLGDKSESFKLTHVKRHGKTLKSITHLTTQEAKVMRERRKLYGGGPFEEEGEDEGKKGEEDDCVVISTSSAEGGRGKREKMMSIKGKEAKANQAAAENKILKGIEVEISQSALTTSVEASASSATAPSSRGHRKKIERSSEGKFAIEKAKAMLNTTTAGKNTEGTTANKSKSTIIINSSAADIAMKRKTTTAPQRGAKRKREAVDGQTVTEKKRDLPTAAWSSGATTEAPASDMSALEKGVEKGRGAVDETAAIKKRKTVSTMTRNLDSTIENTTTSSSSDITASAPVPPSNIAKPASSKETSTLKGKARKIREATDKEPETKKRKTALATTRNAGHAFEDTAGSSSNNTPSIQDASEYTAKPTTTENKSAPKTTITKKRTGGDITTTMSKRKAAAPQPGSKGPTTKKAVGKSSNATASDSNNIPSPAKPATSEDPKAKSKKPRTGGGGGGDNPTTISQKSATTSKPRSKGPHCQKSHRQIFKICLRDCS